MVYGLSCVYPQFSSLPGIDKSPLKSHVIYSLLNKTAAFTERLRSEAFFQPEVFFMKKGVLITDED
jgi:hypothetical protein